MYLSFSFNLRLEVRDTFEYMGFVGSNPTEGKICFSHFTLLERNVKNCFVKLIKTLKINNNEIYVQYYCILTKLELALL